MKLLFDANLSPKLAARLSDLFPGSSHVRQEPACGTEDIDIWNFAQQGGFTIVTKDSDFDNLALLFDKPPKVIGVRLGNCTTQAVEILVRTSYDDLVRFQDSTDEVLKILP